VHTYQTVVDVNHELHSWTVFRWRRPCPGFGL
jgi:hypothetical protein